VTELVSFLQVQVIYKFHLMRSICAIHINSMTSGAVWLSFFVIINRNQCSVVEYDNSNTVKV